MKIDFAYHARTVMSPARSDIVCVLAFVLAAQFALPGKITNFISSTCLMQCHHSEYLDIEIGAMSVVSSILYLIIFYVDKCREMDEEMYPFGLFI